MHFELQDFKKERQEDFSSVENPTLHCVGSKVPTAVVMKGSIFWDITMSSPL
jgi:hypothetical protein